MNILVTGGAGFLGSGLISELKRRGHHIRALLRRKESASNLHRLEVELFFCNILDKETLDDAVKDIDVIFHTAAIYKAYPFYDRNAHDIYMTNIEGTRNVFEAALKAGVKKIIYTSSTAAIGKMENGSPADENIKLNHLSRRSHYEKSKALAEDVALSYHKKGIQVISINPSFLFGIRDSRPTPTGELVVKFLNQEYPCTFDALLCVSDLDMVVETHLKAMEKGISGERYIVACDRHYSLQEVFNELGSITGIRKPLIKLPIGCVYLFSLINESILFILGLKNRIAPIVASEVVKFFSLRAKYSGIKAKSYFALKDKTLREILIPVVHWYMLNGYIKKSSRIKYFKKIGKL